MLRIVLDAMGGDAAPGQAIAGAYLAVKSLQVHIILVGPKNILEKEIRKYKKWPEGRISVHHAPEVVEMSESPSLSFRRKKESSIRVGIDLVKSGQADAFVSAGNTGAVVTTSLLVYGKSHGVERPALPGIFPSEKGPLIVVDIGSNVDCKPSFLVQFAIMGKCMAESIIGIENPRVGLLNIGEEKEKGNDLTQKTYFKLKKTLINFVGNVEGNEILKGSIDVLVCDGFIGNTLLKFGEGFSEAIMGFFKGEARSSIISFLGLLLLKPALRCFKKRFDYDEFGGSPLLGLNGVSVIAHGSASPRAIRSAIRSAKYAVENDIVGKISGAVC